MGWVCEDGRHEGYFVGVVPINDWRFRELASGDVEQVVKVLQVACDCGWRSPRFCAPFGTRFVPSIIVIPQDLPPTPLCPEGRDHHLEVEGRALWLQHTLELAPLPERPLRIGGFPHLAAAAAVLR